jgi:hypothetical protein
MNTSKKFMNTNEHESKIIEHEWTRVRIHEHEWTRVRNSWTRTKNSWAEWKRV